MARVDRNVLATPAFVCFQWGRCASASGSRIPRSPHRLVERLFRMAVTLLPVLFTGCQSFSNPISQWRAAYDGGLFRGVSKDEMADASSSVGSDNLFDRWLTPRRSPMGKSDGSDSSTLVLGSDGWRPMTKAPKDPKADAELQSALTLFQQGKFEEAEKAYTKIAKDRKSTPWGETAQYYLAETQYQRGKYVDAHDSFEKLHADYPVTEYLDKLVSREYAIAQLWMQQDDPKAPKDKLLPWYSRFYGRFAILDKEW
jgi:tetratricopeptide (TPR) repeat protein